jgi:hypothetical protein
MATKKRKVLRKKHLSASAGLSRKVGHHRRVRTRKKHGLSEMFNKATAMSTAKGAVSGAIGGYGWGMVSKNLSEKMKPMEKILIGLGASFIVGSVVKMPNISAGIGGALGYELAMEGIEGLHEFNDYEYMEAGNLEEMAEYMDEGGNPMFLAGDGKLYYLDEMNDMDEFNEGSDQYRMSEEPIFLAASDYPSYVNASTY